MNAPRPPAGPHGPAGGSPNTTPAETTRRPVRHFGTRLRFVSHGGGRWLASHAGERIELERRRAEPGCPAGWWYFGPGAVNGVWAGDYIEAAAALAADHAHRATREVER